MVVVGVIEDQWVDLLKVCVNFMVHATSGNDIAVRPYLLADFEAPEDQDVRDIQQEVQRYHPNIKLPPISVLPPANLREPEQVKPIVRRLAEDGVDVIISDSQIGDDEVAGLRLLDAALTNEDYRHRGWSCYLMTKHFESASRWIYKREAGAVDSRIRFLDKTKLLGSFPDECAEAASEMLEREIRVKAAAEKMAGKTRFGRFVGASKSLNEGRTSVYALAQIAATTDSRVLIRGETGSGKEVLARAIHEESGRKHQPFVAVDCGALSESMIESELFGHVRGAFTGAVADFKGKIFLADKGTLFLDEIANMPLSTQVKFLRVIAEQEVMPLGGSQLKKVDFRLISATNAPLEKLIATDRFLYDLFGRIKTWEIILPPLRERREDIPVLVADLVQRLAAKVGRRQFVVADDCMPLLQQASWPENVRGLSDCLERAMGLALQGATTGDVAITTEHVCLALPKIESVAAKLVVPFQGERNNPEPTMSTEEIWAGLRDDRLRRQSLPELVDRLGRDRVAAILLRAEDSIVSAKGLEKYFPGSTPAYKRALKSRYKKRGTA